MSSEPRTPLDRSRSALPENIRETLEASNLPVEVATAIADLCESAESAETGSAEPLWADVELAWREWTGGKMSDRRFSEVVSQYIATRIHYGAHSAGGEKMPRTFEYLLNAMENAAAAHNPHLEGYGKKRQAVFQHVEDLWDDYMRLLREKQDRLDAPSVPSSEAEKIAQLEWLLKETKDQLAHDQKELFALKSAQSATALPMVPTEAMIQAMENAMWEDGGKVTPGTVEYEHWCDVYRALLRAADRGVPNG